jgi:hypothetical protein
MKIIRLSVLPPDALKRAKEARLRVYFAIQDYSWHDGGKANGLDESFEVIVNGKVHTYRTDDGFIAKAHEKEAMRWTWQDFIIPVGELLPGENRFVFKKADSPAEASAKAGGPKYDDYIYVGIDNTVNHGNSLMSSDGGKTWSGKSLNAINAAGEYMVRLVLIEKDLSVRAVWDLREKGKPNDPAGIIGYAGIEEGREGAPPCALLQLDVAKLDRTIPPTATIEMEGTTPPKVEWQDAEGKVMRVRTERSGNSLIVTPLRSLVQPDQLVVFGSEGKPPALRVVKVEAALHYLPEPVISMCPKISPPSGAPGALVNLEVRKGQALLENHQLSCRFSVADRLRLASLRNSYSASEMARGAAPLFLVEIGGKRYSGAEDFACRTVRALEGKRRGFEADLFLREHSLRAVFTDSIAAEEMRWGLTLTNEGQKPLDFKVAFPALGGLAVSDDPAADYYFFPWGGGVIADVPAIIRRGYGDHAALYQVMDVFSPGRGAGLLVRTDDAEGWYKVLALRKTVPGKSEFQGDKATTPTKDDYKWMIPSLVATDASAPPPAAGISLAYEYLRRTGDPGKSFTPADAVIEAHPGDWHEAMKRYAAWAHRVWKFRPPSRFDNVINVLAAGWGQSPLFKDGAYRTDFMKPMTDCIELMSWWEWSLLGPWRTPFDKVKEVIGEAKYKRWLPYFVKDPVTGKTMFGNQPGDYDGYNERFGGLPAFRKAVQTYKDMGALVTLYTDPIRCDDGTKMGQKYGKLWGVVKPDGKYVDNYEVWNMCHDVAEYRQWVAETMKRVMRETGADGIRLDEYGHKGWACFSTLHKHTFAEPGCQEWMRCIAETSKLVHAAMDEVRPDAVLTTEHPGYDFLMQFLDGCITYDLTGQATPLRPLECNIQRFYFPECRAYELDHRGADKKHEKRFWNAEGSFGAYYPLPMYTILKENRDVFHSPNCEPLVPTLLERVYANRFSSGDKEITMLYNARGVIVDAPVLEAAEDPTLHYFDLLACKELQVRHVAQSSLGPPEADGPPAHGSAPGGPPAAVPATPGKPDLSRLRGPSVSLKIQRDRTACVARLPRALTVRRQGDDLLVTVGEAQAPLELLVASQEGEALQQQEAHPGENKLTLAIPKDAAGPACVKLLQGQCLLDAAELPSR